MTTTEDAEALPTAPCPEIVMTPETEEERRIEMVEEEKEKRRKSTAGAEVDHRSDVKQTWIN